MLDFFGNHIVGFPTRRLILLSVYMHMLHILSEKSRNLSIGMTSVG